MRSNEQQPTTDRQVQHLVVLFEERDPRTIQQYVEEMEAQLADEGIPATTLHYGVGPRALGFLIVECAWRIPGSVLRALREDTQVREVLCYDVPCFEQERQAELATPTNTSRQPSAFLHVPQVPDGYQALDEPRLLLNPLDGRWAVLAHGTLEAGDGDGDGVLVYDAGQDEQQRVAFFTQEEVIALLDLLLSWAPYFLLLCSERYQAQHAERIKRIEVAEVAYRASSAGHLVPRPETEARLQAQNPSDAVQRLLDWIDQHPYRLVPDEEIGGFRLIPDDEQEDEEAQQ